MVLLWWKINFGEEHDEVDEYSEDEEGEEGEMEKKRKCARTSPIPKVSADRATKKSVSPAVVPNDQSPE